QTGTATPLAAAQGQAVNCLGCSAQGDLWAWGGQAGELCLWQAQTSQPSVLAAYDGAWIDTLAWHPTLPLLAYGIGSTVHIWEATTQQAVAALNFEASSALHLAWHPQGDRLAVSGHGGVKVWSQADWTAPPTAIDVPGASLCCAWSADGRYLGSGNLDRTLTVTEWGSPPPWLMQGFPGKVRQIDWSMPDTSLGSPLVAAACVEGITVWERGPQAKKGGWQSQVLQHHQDRVNAIAFQPNSLLLASAGQDGRVALWREGRKLDQSLQVFSTGVSTLAWSPTGDRLLAGGNNGEVVLWQVSRRAQGFG
ncbi:WD40 repeat domain-containing protein, partial [Halomicronema sp. CCY15110]|uniref:WD40 repeat domain-containing protein n=1 Tax=Halomicronema sp. CCY15110 TaxID=2767773 RepID=UPI00194FBF66